MAEPMKLVYKQHALDVKCSATDDCECSFCSSCKFAIDVVNHLLAICCENDLKQHYNWLVANLDALFAAAAERMNANEYIQ